MAPSPPPSGLAMTGQLAVNTFWSRAILMSWRAKRSLPPPGPVSTMNWTLLGVPLVEEPLTPIALQAGRAKAAAAATASNRSRVVDAFIDLPLGFGHLG